MSNKSHPYDELGGLFWDTFPTGLEKDSFENELKNFSYRLRMFWLQRPDKLSEKDYPLYIFITNQCHSDKLRKPLAKHFKPLLDATPIMSDYCHYDLVKNCIDNIREYYYMKQPELRPKNKRKWWKIWA